MHDNNARDLHSKSSGLLVMPLSKFFLFSFLSIIFITTSVYFTSLNNQFTSWDDPGYITENPDIKTFNNDSLGSTFQKISSSYVMGNYHPLTMLSYCLDYNFFGLNPTAYHTTNLILHLFNALLVFCFIWLLSKQRWVAFITALLFAIHPMHVESVAWASERKDVLYSFFYLAGLCSYIFYLQTEKKKTIFYALTFLLFILAVLSKALAVSLPIAFFAIDYYLDRKINLRSILEKAPFIILSLVFGYIAIDAQESGIELGAFIQYDFFDRILFTSYAILMYVWKLLLPFNLSCLYTYPELQDDVYPFIFYLAPLLLIAIGFLIYKLKILKKDILFGALFFIITIAFVLQILPVGGAIMADRYSYLPYIGLFFIIARSINYLLENKSEQIKNLKTPSIGVLIFFILMCCFLTFQRAKAWHNTISLWSSAIKVYDGDALPYKVRGLEYYRTKQYGLAITDFNKAIELQKGSADAYNNRGLAYYEMQKYDAAINDFNMAIQLKSDYPDAHFNRGNCYFGIGNMEDAITDFTATIQVSPKSEKAYYNRGNAYYNLQKYDLAFQDFSTAITYDSTFALAYNNRGNIYLKYGAYAEGISNYSAAILYDPSFANAYMNRCKAFAALQKFQPALEDALKAKDLGYNVDPNYINAIQEQIMRTTSSH
jgi:protein O-mannosyl-transferase